LVVVRSVIENPAVPARPAQVYETTIYDRESGQWFSVASVPVRSLADEDAVSVASYLAGGEAAQPASVESWRLPFLLDAVLRRYPSLDWEWERWEHRDRFFLYPNRDGPSAFAQQLAYDRVLPVESSPLTGRSLSELLVSGGIVTAYVTHHPAIVFAGPAGVFLCTVARHLGDGIGIPMRDRLWRALGASEESLNRDADTSDDEPDEDEQGDD
jgi:hypothetical protein